MLYLVAAAALCLAIWKSLQGGWRGQRGFQVIGFDLGGAALGGLAVGLAVYFLGAFYGIAFVVAVAVHEFGHVAAYRVCGHADARFRLIPLLGGVTISNTAPASSDKALFITLMGPAINLGPMALCLALAAILSSAEFDSTLPYQIGNYLYIQGMVFAGLNFFNLLPLWPLDGGKLTQRLVYSFAPGLTRQASLAMIVLALALCLLTRSWFLLFLVVMGWPGLVQSEALLHAQRPLSHHQRLLALGAYLTTAAAFFIGVQPLLIALL